MDRAATHRLIARLLEAIDSGTGDEAPEPMTEAVEDLLSPERFAEERTRLFLDVPQVVGFAGEVAEPGSVLTAESMGVPIVVTRDADGDLRAFVNACAHRGARVATGCGTRQRLTCGFHGWTYRLDGSLAGRPSDGAFAPADDGCSLTRLPVSDRSGLVVVGLRSDIPQTRVDEHLASIEGEMTGFGFGEMRPLEGRRYEVAASWKIVAALSYESYHFPTLHRDSVARFFHTPAVHDVFAPHARWAFAFRGIEDLAERDPSTWPDVLPGVVSHTLFPSTVVIANPDDAQIIRAEPGPTVDTCIVHYSGGYRGEHRRDAALAAYEFGGRAFEDEDLPAAVECQQGLAAGRTLVHIGRNEPLVQHWHRVWRESVER